VPADTLLPQGKKVHVSTPNGEPLTLSADLLLPRLLSAHPEARTVFDRYGLRGCGGPLGPYESIRFFARAHGVDETRLLAELKRAIDSPEAAGEPSEHSPADTIYRRFFVGGIVVVLTAGATWGAWLLWRIGLGASFRAISLNSVNAHGEAQIFGWVGLFIMGFAYQALPRVWHTTLAQPRLAAWTFALAVAGLLIRTLGITTAGDWIWGLPLAMGGGGLQVAAVGLFVSQMLATFRRSGARLDAYVGFVIAALLWFVVSSVLSVWHTWNTLTARSLPELLWYVATYQGPLRDLQIHGLALSMILGVSLRMFPGLFDLPRVPERRAWWALNLLTTAVIGETLVFLIYRWTGRRILLAALPFAWLMLVAAVALVVLPWRIWRPFPLRDRSGKFVRAAYSWLAVSLAMVLFSPVYHRVAGLRFSHAYSGATRHAITVGFISLMIMGMAAKVVPTLNGVDPRSLSRLWGPFLLVNAGCLLRVAGQIVTDWSARVYAILGLSGTLEVTGLAWWGLGLVWIILQGTRRESGVPPPRQTRPDQIAEHHHVADVLAWYPQTEAVFLQHGFTALHNPVLRRTLARQVSIRQAAALRGAELEALLEALNATIPRGFPVLTVISFSMSQALEGARS
jgi:hypothetical protein